MTQSKPFSDEVFKDNLDFIKKLWNSMSVPGMNTPGMPLPPMSLEELDKRIQELKSVEAWLNMNANMLRNAIQALEVQRATTAALQAMANSMPGPDGQKDGTAADFVNQSMVWWSALQEQFKQTLQSTLSTKNPEKPSTSTTKKTKSSARKSSAASKTPTPKTR